MYGLSHDLDKLLWGWRILFGHLHDTILAKLLVAIVFGFRETVGIQENGCSCIDVGLLFAELPVTDNTDGQIGGAG